MYTSVWVRSSPLPPAKTDKNSVEHLIHCSACPTQLTVEDLWDDLNATADFLNLNDACRKEERRCWATTMTTDRLMHGTRINYRSAQPVLGLLTENI